MFIDKLSVGCTAYPIPLVMRRIYCQFWPPADGLESEAVDLTEFEVAPSYSKKAAS